MRKKFYFYFYIYIYIYLTFLSSETRYFTTMTRPHEANLFLLFLTKILNHSGISICRSQKGNSVNFQIDQSKMELTEWPVKVRQSISKLTDLRSVKNGMSIFSIFPITCGHYNTSDYNL